MESNVRNLEIRLTLTLFGAHLDIGFDGLEFRFGTYALFDCHENERILHHFHLYDEMMMDDQERWKMR
nr:hypothetical protein [Tanacetum cinerariifolium]